MMTLYLILILGAFPQAQAPSGQSSYAGQEQREIKALSAAEIQDYLAGKGMGLAKAAELNHYPGPLHVLELAEQLGLSEAQVAEAQKLRQQVREEASRLGAQVVEKEQALDRLFAEQKIDEARLQSLMSEIGKLQGELRFVHLKAHLAMKRILTPPQIETYDRLRGYGAGHVPSPQHHQKP